ncbi:MAG: family 16 glycosylhydrolase [Flavicella sp.]|nr:family 16 glycosylhydrolase [Flavicella sp.]
MKSPLLKIAFLLACIPLWSQTEELVWSDEFNIDGAIDSNKWFHQTQLPAGGGWYNNEAQHYTNRLENSYVSGGNLNLVAIKESFTDQGRTKEYTSARLNSKAAFKYGRMEIRAKLPTGSGTWPAIWMLGKNINEDGGYWDNNGYGSTPWPACGEIDIMEHWGNNQNYVSSAMHTPSSYGGTFNTGGRYLSTASTAFHVYELDWNAQRMIFSVDGIVHYTYNPTTKDANTWPFDAEQYFLLNVAIEGGGANITQTAMEIDYIRVYQTEGSDGGGGGGGNPGTTSPTDAPTAPTASAADVISLFSEAYTDVPNTNWTPNWGQSTVSSLETIAGNEVRKYTNLNYIGVALDDAQYQDVSSFEKIHFDYWTADASDLSLALISPGPSENPVSVEAISTGAWQSVDIPLSSYSTPDLSEIFQLKFEGSGTVYIDNVYFYKTGAGSGGGNGGGGNPGAPTPTKASADVISVYSDAYSSIATNLNPNWGQATQTTEIQIDGNNTLEYANLNYQGLDYSTTDVSAMEYVHLDYKTADATALDFFLISENPTVENAYSIPVVTGSWQSIDIPLSVYTANLDRVFQFKTVGNGTVYLDNLYFWKAPTQNTGTSLSNLTVNGSTVTGFSSATTSYTIELPEGSAVPTVIATPTDGNATAVVTNATSLPGDTTVTVTTTGGASQTYTISFVYEASDSELSAYDNFEGDGNITTWAEDGTTMDTGFSNPFSTGINNSNNVLKYQDAGGQYANIRFDVSENFDLSSNSLFTLKIYVPQAGITGNQPNQISLKLQDGTLGEPWGTQCEIIKPIVLDQWQEITFDFDDDTYFNLDDNSPDPMTRSDFNRVVLQVNSENNNDQVVAYLDDFLYNSILYVKEVVRPISMYPNPVKDKLNISEEFDFVEVYNMTGRKVLKSKSSPLSMESLPKGIYLVRVRSKYKTTSSKIIKE